MKKTKRRLKVDELLRALPAPPSNNNKVKWDFSLSANDYYDEAAKAIAISEARLEIFRKASLPNKWHQAEIANYSLAERLLWEAKRQLLQDRFGLRELLDRNNWACRRPRLSVVADINVRGNLTVRWTSPEPQALTPPDYRLANTTGFDERFFRKMFYRTEQYGNTRPAAELMWFRDVPLVWKDTDHPAIRCIIYAIHSKYQQILGDIGRQIEVCKRFGIPAG